MELIQPWQKHACAEYSFSRAGTILVVSLKGEASNERDCIGIYSHLCNAMQSTAAGWLRGVVFDFASLTYEWGDGMSELIGSWGVPIAIVIGPKNSAGLESLLKDEGLDNPESYLFTSLAVALTHVRDAI
jgi:hypothetical protein